MPSKRTPIARFRRSPPVDREMWDYFHDRPVDTLFQFVHSDEELRAIWLQYADEIVARWATDPATAGTRPTCWWLWSAPLWPRDQVPARLRGSFEDKQGLLCEPRRKLSGSGEPAYWLAWHTVSGVPIQWQDIDWSDPPVIESEFEYLQRHRLLFETETNENTNERVITLSTSTADFVAKHSKAV